MTTSAWLASGSLAKWATDPRSRSTFRITRISLSWCGEWRPFTWKNTRLTYTDGITYYAFVEDNHPIRPHRVASELRFIDILPYKQAFQYVEGGGT